MVTIKNSLFALMALLLLASCDKARVFDEYKEFDGGWPINNKAQFTFDATDTVSRYNMFVTTRANNSYPYSNLFIIVQMEQPDSKLVKVDTLEYQMANPDGSLMGSGFSDIKESKLWYKENVNFPKKGKYTFTVQQAVRESGKVPGVENLDGITEVGFRIENKEE
jgi:gliding motility-associated lipoprotein GldH